MIARLTWVVTLAGLLLPLGSAEGGGPPLPASDTAPASAQALAAQIDRHLARRWDEAQVQPAPLAGDAEFLRRIYFDLAGRIPSVAEARAFLTDRRSDRRTRLIEQLLASPRFATHFANVYRALLIPEASNNFVVRLQQGGFEKWLRQQVARNVGYDQMTRELLTAPMSNVNIAALFTGNGKPTPLAFYFAKEFQPETLAAGTARVFLGVSVECAQCHNHPFAKWKREQFWSFAAFFSGIQAQQLMDIKVPRRDIADKKDLAIPGTAKVVQARFLDDAQPQWKPSVPTRTTLAEWVTAPSNPYFARTAVNRTWAYFFGTGLVEPINEMVGSETKNSHPELLDLLAREFSAHRFDMKFLIRAITSTRAYQLTSAKAKRQATKSEQQDDPTLFARMPLRGLTPEQLFDSLALATGYRDSGGAGNDLLSAIGGGKRSARAEFLTKFANQMDRPTHAQTSILQAMSLMNGKVVADATSLEHSETLGALLDAPFLTTVERIETLYLATLSRQPTARERTRMVRFIENAGRESKGSDAQARRSAYNNAVADVFWALLNSSEFVLNH